VGKELTRRTLVLVVLGLFDSYMKKKTSLSFIANYIGTRLWSKLNKKTKTWERKRRYFLTE